MQEFISRPGGEERRWAVAQATFSLHSLPTAERLEPLGWLCAHCDTLLVAEFDAPLMDEPLRPDIIRHVLGRYREGLSEYSGAGFETVAQVRRPSPAEARLQSPGRHGAQPSRRREKRHSK